MTRRRWIADEVSGNRAALTGDHAAHLARVLRARIGQEFDITAQNALRRGVVVAVNDARVEFELGEEVSAAAIANITVALSIFKFDRMEWAIEKCTELGASRIIPLIAQRTETHLAAAVQKRRERWQRLALQASEQSRRLAPPEISHPIKLKDGVALSGAAGIVLSEAEGAAMLRDLVQPNVAKLILAFGPEGGWTEAELKLFQQAGWLSASLGPTVLRAETAAIAALAIAISQVQSEL